MFFLLHFWTLSRDIHSRFILIQLIIHPQPLLPCITEMLPTSRREMFPAYIKKDKKKEKKIKQEYKLGCTSCSACKCEIKVFSIKGKRARYFPASKRTLWENKSLEILSNCLRSGKGNTYLISVDDRSWPDILQYRNLPRISPGIRKESEGCIPVGAAEIWAQRCWTNSFVLCNNGFLCEAFYFLSQVPRIFFYVCTI